MRFVFLKCVERLYRSEEELIAWVVVAYFKSIISEVRPAGLSDGLKVRGEMELVMRERKKET